MSMIRVWFCQIKAINKIEKQLKKHMKIVKKIKTRFEGFGHGLLYNTTGYVTLWDKNEEPYISMQYCHGKSEQKRF